MVLPMVSQNISTTGETTKRVNTYINERGDTMVSMHYEDARILLRDVLYYEFTDSLLREYKALDTLNTNKITLQKSLIDNLSQEKMNLETMVTNLELVIANKDTEMVFKDDIIKQQKKEIRKQKFLKVVGFIGTVVVPIIVLIAVL